MDVEDPETGKTRRQMVAEHLLEVATRWQVLVFGKSLEVASARDSVEAAKLLFGYCLGSPPKTPNALDIAEHIRSVSRDQVEVIKTMLGARLATMTPEEIGRVIAVSEQGDPLRFLKAAQQTLAHAAQVEGDAEPAELPEPKTEPALPDPSKEEMSDPGCAHELCSGCSECEPDIEPEGGK